MLAASSISELELTLVSTGEQRGYHPFLTLRIMYPELNLGTEI